jgi:hypothetical protein
MYEEGDYLNSHHMPVELGDIFKKSAGNKMRQFQNPCFPDSLLEFSGDFDRFAQPLTGCETASCTFFSLNHVT